MKILDRYLGTRLLAALFKVMVSLVLLFILIDLLTHRRGEIVRHDIPWLVVLRYYAAYTPTILYEHQVAAFSMLVAALLVLGGAAQNNEVIAALAGGIGLRRLVLVPILISVALAVGVFIMQESFGAAARRQADNLEARYFSRDGAIRDGISWPDLAGNWTCHIMKFNRTALTGENVSMHSIRDDAVELIQARRIFWDPALAKWMLEDGRWFTFFPNKNWDYVVPRITRRAAPIVETPQELFALEQAPETRTVGQLREDIRRAVSHGMPVQGHWTDFYAKFSQPALAFVMIFLAIPFAMRLRRGGLAIGFGVSIAIALAYLILFRMGMGLGHVERLPAPLAAWLATAVFLVAGLEMFRRTPT